MERLLEKILTLTNIGEITEVISAYLKKPVVIEDDQFSLLAYSSFYIEQFDEANKQTIFLKRWSIPILEMFMDRGIVDQLKSIPKPFRVGQIKEIGLNPRVVVSAKYKNQILGFIWIQETGGSLSNADLDFLYEVSHHIGKILYQKKQLKLKKDEKKNNLYQKILDEEFHTEAQVKWEAANVNISIPDSYIIAIFTAGEASEEIFGELLEKVGLFSNALKFPAHLFIDQWKIVVMIGSNLSPPGELTESANELASTVLSQFSEQEIYPGISKERSSILQLKKSYMEAMEVIKTAKLAGLDALPSFEYKQLGLFRYLETISQYQAKMNYVNEDLLKLKQKDKEDQTSLLQTLEVYLAQNCRLKPTAEKLFIHINTLKYRLNQIAELTTITFDDFQTNCELYMDLQILKATENDK
jgi:DNA-binding PucR family transcriptional regulator